MTTATETRPNLAADMMDAWMASYKSATWTQDQLETLTGSWVNQARTMRNDGQKVLEIIVSQAKHNADDAQRVTESVMQRAMAGVPGWDMLTRNDLRRQVEDLNARVDALGAK